MAAIIRGSDHNYKLLLTKGSGKKENTLGSSTWRYQGRENPNGLKDKRPTRLGSSWPRPRRYARWPAHWSTDWPTDRQANRHKTTKTRRVYACPAGEAGEVPCATEKSFFLVDARSLPCFIHSTFDNAVNTSGRKTAKKARQQQLPPQQTLCKEGTIASSYKNVLPSLCQASELEETLSSR